MARPSYPELRSDGSDDPRKIALVVNGAMKGRTNNILEIDVPDSVSSVLFEDARITDASVPLTPVGSGITGFVYVSEGKATIDVAPGPARVERIVLLG